MSHFRQMAVQNLLPSNKNTNTSNLSNQAASNLRNEASDSAASAQGISKVLTSIKGYSKKSNPRDGNNGVTTHQRGYSHNQALMAHLELKKGSPKLLDSRTNDNQHQMRNSLGVHPLALNIASQVKHRHINSISMTGSLQQQTAILDSSKAYGSVTKATDTHGTKHHQPQHNGGSNRLVPFSELPLNKHNKETSQQSTSFRRPK